MFLHKPTRLLAVVAAAIVIAAGAYGVVSTTASTGSAATTPAPSTPTRSGPFLARGGGSNARSGPAAGGASGTVASVSPSNFTLTTPAGQQVTVNTASSTSSIHKGDSVLVLGTVNGTTISAGQVVMQAGSSAGSATSAAAVVPFQPGAASTSKQVGQIPASYSQGSGTIVSGTPANRATEAALAAYPGGIVDRVVKLSSGEYEVHNIGVNWPHHIFVNQNFKVIGAN